MDRTRPADAFRCVRLAHRADGIEVWLGIAATADGERPCVIQLLDRGCDDLRRQRFLAEGQLGIALSSPPIDDGDGDGAGEPASSAHLLTTLGAGAWPDGRCFIALDRVEGIALSRAFGAIARDPRKVRAIASAVLDALAHVHQRGVMHGAVGPDSIVIGVDGVVVLGGLSHARRAERAFQRRDLSALGIVLCGLVTGVPFDEIADAPADALAEVAPDLSELIRQLLLGSRSARALRGLLFEHGEPMATRDEMAAIRADPEDAGNGGGGDGAEAGGRDAADAAASVASVAPVVELDASDVALGSLLEWLGGHAGALGEATRALSEASRAVGEAARALRPWPAAAVGALAIAFVAVLGLVLAVRAPAPGGERSESVARAEPAPVDAERAEPSPMREHAPITRGEQDGRAERAEFDDRAERDDRDDFDRRYAHDERDDFDRRYAHDEHDDFDRRYAHEARDRTLRGETATNDRAVAEETGRGGQGPRDDAISGARRLATSPGRAQRRDDRHSGEEVRTDRLQAVHTTDGVVVRWEVLRATESVLIPILIANGSQADWQVSTIDLLARQRSSRVKAVQFSPRGDNAESGCSGDGIIPAGTRCELLVSIPDPARYAGVAISLVLANARGEPTAVLTGIQM